MRQGFSEDRRKFVSALARAGGLSAAVAGTGVWLSRRKSTARESQAPLVSRNYAVTPNPQLPELAVIRGQDAAAAVRDAVAALGGMNRFISRGDVVVLKPNMAWDRTPEQAANTSPAVVAELARLSFEAGARRVVVADVPINEPRRVAERSGIGAAARLSGATLELPGERSFREVDLGGEVLRLWPVFRPYLEADKVINVPAAKQHSLTRVTLGLKNWYGILGGRRHRLHQQISESLADLATFIRPTLTVVDGWRVLVRNGPGGGNLEDVEWKKTILAGTDPVAIEAYAASTFFGIEPATLPYLALASNRGAGRLTFEDLRIVRAG